MKVWKWGPRGLDELEVRPVPGLPSRVVRGCENCSHQLTLGRDVYRTKGEAVRARMRKLVKSIGEQRRAVMKLEAELAVLAQLEEARLTKKRV